MNISITRVARSRVSEVDRADLPFGGVFTDHMAIVDYADGAWRNPRVVPFAPLELSPAAMVLHYGQAVFEGMKVFKNGDGHAVGFRLDAHVARLNRSCARLMMPEVPDELFREMLKAVVSVDTDWIPTAEGSSLYVRPFVIATDAALGVKPSKTYSFIIILSPSGPYYSAPLKLKVEETYSRAAPGGVGSAKAAGNYAASLLPTAQAVSEGFDQVLWTDSATHTFVEESGTMNICFVIDGKLVTPAIGDTVLDSITRSSLVALAHDKGIPVDERRVRVDEVCDAIEKGTLTESFGVGTAVVVAPVASITYKGKTYTVPAPTEQSISMKLKAELSAIRTGAASDPHGWVEILS